MDVAQEEQKHAPVELVDRFVADSNQVANDHLVGAVGEDAPAGAGFGRAGHDDGGSQRAAGQEVVTQQADAEGEQQGQLEVGAGLDEPAAARVLAAARPDQGAEGEQGAQRGQSGEQEQGRGCSIGPEEEREQPRLRQHGW